MAWAYNDEEPPSEAEMVAQVERTRRAFAELRARDLSPLVGLRVREAVAEVERMGLRARVVDERVTAIRADASSGRINLYTVQGRVHRATAG